MPSTSWTTTMGSKLLVVLVFIFALFLRLYHLPARAVFSADEEYQATYANTIIEDFHLIWIGVSAADTGFYLGPYFTYLTAFILSISHGDPLATNIFSAILGSVTACLLYLLGSRIFSRRIGFIASLFYAFSPLIIYFDQRYWNPSPSAFLTTLLLYALLYIKEQKWWILAVAFCLGAFWHVHLSLLPLTLVALYYIWRYRRGFTFQHYFFAILLFLLMLAPLFIFDYNHSWSNVLTPLRMLRQGGRGFEFFPHLQSLTSTLARTLFLNPGTSPSAEIRPGCPTTLFTTPSILIGITALFPLVSIITSPILLSSTLILILSYLFYPGEVSGYYLLGFFPLYFLALSYSLSRLKIVWLVIPFYLVCSLYTLKHTDEQYGLHSKREVIAQVTHYLGSHSFSLVEEGTCRRYGGWRYLFSVYGKTPSTSSTDSSLSWLYPQAVGKAGEYTVHLGATSELNIAPSPVATFTFGGYTAYLTYGI